MSVFNFDIEDKTIQGRLAEDNFINIIKKRNINNVIVQATTNQDRNEHWDYEVNGKKIDIKSRKNIGILNLNEDKYTILELQDIKGKLGWLYGQADYIAFELNNFFLVCPRKELVKYVENNVEDIFINDLNNCILKKFTRFGADDIITVVAFNDIQKGAFIIK